MSGIFLAIIGSVGGSMPNITLSSVWNDIILVGNPPPVNGFTGARTLTWAGGGSRTISLVSEVLGTIAYSLNGTAYVNYTAPFSMSSSGLTLQFRYTRILEDEFATVTVRDDTNGNTNISSFSCSVTFTGGL